MTEWRMWKWAWKWERIGREVPCGKEGLRYVDRLDELLNIAYTIVGSKRRYFHLAPEFPDGDRYWECINSS